MEKSVVKYQNEKAYVDDAIIEVKKFAEELESVPNEEFNSLYYKLLEAIDYLDRVFTSFAEMNIPETRQ